MPTEKKQGGTGSILNSKHVQISSTFQSDQDNKLHSKAKIHQNRAFRRILTSSQPCEQLQSHPRRARGRCGEPPADPSPILSRFRELLPSNRSRQTDKAANLSHTPKEPSASIYLGSSSEPVDESIKQNEQIVVPLRPLSSTDRMSFDRNHKQPRVIGRTIVRGSFVLEPELRPQVSQSRPPNQRRKELTLMSELQACFLCSGSERTVAIPEIETHSPVLSL